MDNFFEILIYLFIIISFISSFFKKKKPEQTNKKIPPIPPQHIPQSKTSEQEEYDILKEIEKMFKTETSLPDQQEERTIEQGEKRFETASEHLETDWHKEVPSEHQTTISERTFADWETKIKKAEEQRKAINEKILSQAQVFEKHLTAKTVSEEDFRGKLINSFKNPQTLKEYFIFSEVIGKPKAFQE